MGDEKEVCMVPLIVFQAEQSRLTVILKRVIIAFVIYAVVTLMVITGIIGMAMYERLQYDTVTTEESSVVEQSSDDGGDVNYIGNDGDINNGLPESD